MYSLPKQQCLTTPDDEMLSISEKPWPNHTIPMQAPAITYLNAAGLTTHGMFQFSSVFLTET